jgi:hypothetical protein
MLYLNFKFIYYTQNWSKYCSMSFFFRSKFKSQNLYNPGASGGQAPLVPLPGLCPGPTGGIKRSPESSPKLFGTSYILESTSSLKKIVKLLHQSQDIYSPISQIVLKNFMKISLMSWRNFNQIGNCSEDLKV